MRVVIKSLLSLLTIGALSLSASTVYVKEDVDAKEAKVYAGVPMVQNGDKFEYTGFKKGETLYATKNLSLEVAKIKSDDAIKVVDGNKVTLSMNLSGDHFVEDYYDAWELKEEIFLEKCSQCHAAPDIYGHTMLEWEGLYISMKGFAQPTDEEERVILRYLKTFAKDGIIKEE